MKPGFKTAYLDTRSQDGRNDTLLSELHFRDYNGDLYKVPVGSPTDGGSTPRFSWLVPGFEPFGDHWFSWVLHDSGCRGTLQVMKTGTFTYYPAKLSRLESDKLLDRALTTMGMSPAKRKAVFAGVRIGAMNFKRL
jgi:hypothetical protein